MAPRLLAAASAVKRLVASIPGLMCYTCEGMTGRWADASEASRAAPLYAGRAMIFFSSYGHKLIRRICVRIST